MSSRCYFQFDRETEEIFLVRKGLIYTINIKDGARFKARSARGPWDAGDEENASKGRGISLRDNASKNISI